MTLDSNEFSFTTLIYILWANKQELCRFTYFHLLIHTLNTQLLLLRRHMRIVPHSVTNTNISMHLCWGNQYNQSFCPHVSRNTRLRTYTSTTDTHIHSHTGQAENWPRLPGLEPHSTVSHSSQRTNRSFHKVVSTCQLLASYSQNKWFVTYPHCR